ncbi:MAG: helix-turn-helix transcriptional regulator [Parachlamydia sp.]|nr:helix-turn-helix transcriptional regulator [Parachlamydia sp.]
MKKHETASTYDELMQDSEFKKKYEQSYLELVLSELLLAVMAQDKISIRSLAKQAGISPAIIQDIRSGKRDNITLKTFASLMDALGYNLVLEKRENKKGPPKRIKMSNMGSRRIKRRAAV